VASGSPGTNYGTSSNIYIQSSTASGSFGVERGWLKFDLSGIPTGSTITGASLQLWNWKATGAALPVEVRGATIDSWTEGGLNYANQPAFGSVIDTQTLAAGVTNVWYGWNVTPFVQGQFAGDKVVSLAVKAVDEALAGGPSYGFDSKEYGSNAPVLQVTTQATASSVANLKYYYRYSSDNSSWGSWAQTGGSLTVAPYSNNFSFPNGPGYYEFYSVATDNLGGAEPAPAFAQTAVHYQAASGAAQTVSFTQPADAPVGSAFSVAATATSGLPVTFSSQTLGICTVAGSTVSTLTVGTCTVTASQAGDVGYWLPASISRSFAVQALSQTISFGALANVALASGPVTLGASASSGLPVVFSSLSLAVCTVSGNTVTLAAVGTCQIAADQPGNASYAAAPTVTQSFQVTGTGGSVVVPMPPWALALLAVGLLAAMRGGLRQRYPTRLPPTLEQDQP
jgi:hypothetical protein